MLIVEKKISISEKRLRPNELFKEVPKDAFAFFKGNGNLYSIRFGVRDDAKAISSVYEDAYGKNYISPVVYDIKGLETHIEAKNNFWFVSF